MSSLNKKDNFLGCCAQTSLRFRYLTDTSEMAISDVFHSKGFGTLTAIRKQPLSLRGVNGGKCKFSFTPNTQVVSLRGVNVIWILRKDNKPLSLRGGNGLPTKQSSLLSKSAPLTQSPAHLVPFPKGGAYGNN